MRQDKATDLWGTPPSLIAFTKHYFGIERFDFDACANLANSVAPQWHGTQANGSFVDALLNPWNPRMPGGVVWCNPPYSSGNLLAFAKQAVRQFESIDVREQPGTLTVSFGRVQYAPNVDRIIFLGKLDPSTKWFKLLARSPRCHETVLLSPRVAFIDSNTGKPTKGNNFCSVLFDLRRTTPKRKTISLAEFTR